MAVLQKPEETAQFGLFDIDRSELPPAGTYPAVILDVRDRMGVERKKYKTEETEVVDLTAFLFGFRTKDGRAWKIDTRPMKISGHSKSALFKFLSSLLGQPPKYGWDYCELKGTKCLLSVVHAVPEGGGEVYAKVDHAAPIPDWNTAPKKEPQEIQIADDDDDVIPF